MIGVRSVPFAFVPGVVPVWERPGILTLAPTCGALGVSTEDKVGRDVFHNK